jgi:hypothetical protein
MTPYTPPVRGWFDLHPIAEVTMGLLFNLVLVGLFAYYPARWFGLW